VFVRDLSPVVHSLPTDADDGEIELVVRRQLPVLRENGTGYGDGGGKGGAFAQETTARDGVRHGVLLADWAGVIIADEMGKAIRPMRSPKRLRRGRTLTVALPSAPMRRAPP